MLFIAILKVILPYLSLILIPIFWGMSDGRRILNPDKYAVEWHRYKWIVHLLIGLLIYSFMGWKVSICFGVWYWITFDIFVNIARELPFTTIGTTAFLDRIFPNFWVQFSIKLLLLIVSIYLLWHFY